MRTTSVRLADLDLNLLVALDAVLSERHVSRAAIRLHLTQSGVSNALARLRQHFNDPLVTRVGGEMTPTPLGLSLQPELTDLLARLRDFSMRGTTFVAAQSRREFRIVADDYVAYVLMPPTIERLEAEAPGVSIRLLPYSPFATDQMSRGEVDLCIMVRRRQINGLLEETLYEDSLTCVAGPKSPLRGNRLSHQQYRDARHVAFLSSGGNTQFLPSISGPHQVVTAMPTIGAILEIVSQTECIATIGIKIALLYRERFGLRLFAPPFKAPVVPVVMQSQQRSNADLALKWLRGLLLEVGQQINNPGNSLRPASGASRSRAASSE